MKMPVLIDERGKARFKEKKEAYWKKRGKRGKDGEMKDRLMSRRGDYGKKKSGEKRKCKGIHACGGALLV